MFRSADSGVVLADVTEAVLADLLALALADADPDEVTPPRGAAGGWNSERIRWFREYHRAAAAGLDGPSGERTWAIYCNGEPAGSVRLRRTGSSSLAPDAATAAAAAGGGGTGLAAGCEGRDHGSLETGIWLARSMRGRGIGSETLRLIKDLAIAAGADTLVAETTVGNRGALSLLRSAGAVLTPPRVADAGPATGAGSVKAKEKGTGTGTGAEAGTPLGSTTPAAPVIARIRLR